MNAAGVPSLTRTGSESRGSTISGGCVRRWGRWVGAATVRCAAATRAGFLGRPAGAWASRKVWVPALMMLPPKVTGPRPRRRI